MVKRLPRNCVFKYQKKPRRLRHSYPSTIKHGEGTTSLEEALDPLKLTCELHSNLSISKQQIVDAYLMMKRSTEEMEMLQNEMRNTTKHYTGLKLAVQEAICTFSERDDLFGRGAVSLLHNMITALNKRIEECISLPVMVMKH